MDLKKEIVYLIMVLLELMQRFAQIPSEHMAAEVVESLACCVNVKMLDNVHDGRCSRSVHRPSR